jgi:hypothetical protein
MALAMACLIRPTPLYLILPMAGVLAARTAIRRGLTRGLGSFLLTITAFAIVVGPWFLRNTLILGAPVLDTNRGLATVWTMHPLVTDDPADSEDQRLIKDHIQAYPGQAHLYYSYRGADYYRQHPVEASDRVAQVGMGAMKSDPLGALRIWGRNLGQILFLQYPHAQDYLQQAPGMNALRWLFDSWYPTWNRKVNNAIGEGVRAHHWAGLLLAPVGLLAMVWGSGPRNRTQALAMTAILCYFAGLSALVLGYDRLRVPIEPIISAWTAWGVVFLVRILGRKRAGTSGKSTA